MNSWGREQTLFMNIGLFKNIFSLVEHEYKTSHKRTIYSWVFPGHSLCFLKIHCISPI